MFYFTDAVNNKIMTTTSHPSPSGSDAVHVVTESITPIIAGASGGVVLVLILIICSTLIVILIVMKRRKKHDKQHTGRNTVPI